MVNLAKDECCGCMACVEACPVNAIKVVVDDCYNDYPIVDRNTCIECGKCERICPILNMPDLSTPKTVFAGIANDNFIVQESASGGAAAIIGSQFIKEGGIVYGCAELSLTQFQHIRCDSKLSLKKLSGSKYVKSDISLAFNSIQKDLHDGKRVLFVGTPCQVAAVRNYIGAAPMLFCVDLICHGVPSLNFFSRYVSETFGCQYDETLSAYFRWKMPEIKFGIRYKHSNGTIISSETMPGSPYMAAFFSGLSYRENCHKCLFAKQDRVADITLGDFWGLKSDSFNENKGVSLILCNTDKGVLLIDEIKNCMSLEHHTLEDALCGNANLRNPKSRPENKDLFLRDLKHYSIKTCVKKYCTNYNRDNSCLYKLYLKLAIIIYKIRH